MEKILLDSKKTLGGSENEKSLKVNLSSDARKYTRTDIKAKVDLLEEYNLERDNCHNFRFIFNIYPFCTNILFNNMTEIVKDEGSDHCICQNFKDKKTPSTKNPFFNFSTANFNVRQAIRDTEYSHKELGNYVYHCGLNILNNHLLRNKDFEYVSGYGKNDIRNENSENRKDFNSITDFSRDRFGDRISEEMMYLNVNGTSANTEKYDINLHIYSLDSIMGLGEAFNRNVRSVNGWWGVNNITNIDIPLGVEEDRGKYKEYHVNKLMNNNKACEFIDFYPDRSLYSFTPKYNKFRKRTENNWDYCLTYPYKNDYVTFNAVNGNYSGAIRVIGSDIAEIGPGTEKLVLHTMIKHGLKEGDRIRIWYKRPLDDKETKIQDEFRIDYVGNVLNQSEDPEHYFCVDFQKFISYFPEIEKKPDENIPLKFDFFIKKLDKGCECSYYFRIFKKIKQNGRIPASNIGKLAYSETIFGDKASEIIFTDTIDTSFLKDNRGKEVSEIYLTILKRNAGRTLWYQDENTTDERIEFSHCFGEVTSGLDLPKEVKNYNVRKLHNLDLNKINDKSKFDTEPYYRGLKEFVSSLELGKNFDISANIRKTYVPEPLEHNITIEGNDEFFGDIVEYSPYNDEETVLEEVYHRFNTMQRESFINDTFFKFYFDELVKDDFDIVKKGRTIDKSAFYVKETILSQIFYEKEASEKEKSFIPDNIFPEGYFYKPHYKLRIRPKDISPTQGHGKQINADFTRITDEMIGTFRRREEDGKYFHIDGKPEEETDIRGIKIFVPSRLSLSVEEKLILYDTVSGVVYWGKLSEYGIDGKNGPYVIVRFSSVEFFKEKEDKTEFKLVVAPYDAPSYASFLPESGNLFSWKDNAKYSEVDSGDSLYDIPYTNGCLYFESSLRFFLRRQDPFGIYGLFKNENVTREVDNNLIQGEEKNVEHVKFVPNDRNIICN